MTLSGSLLRRTPRLLSSSTIWKPHPNQEHPQPVRMVATTPKSAKGDAKAPASFERKAKVGRPMEVPWQAKVANLVHLVGSVDEPLRSVTANDGVLNAVSSLVAASDVDVPHFWIPIIFRGELAETALCHVKENDVVYVTGELCGDKLVPSSATSAEPSHQVIVHTISFVKELIPKKKEQTTPGKKDDVTSRSVGNQEKTTPEKKDGITSQSETQAKSKKPESSTQSLWNDIINNPQEWLDYRMQKQKGLVKPRFPDFKHKYSQEALWLDDFPEWLSRKIGGLSFAVPEDNFKMASPSSWGNHHVKKVSPSTWGNHNVKKASSSNWDLWKDLLSNPDKWLDNRLTKGKPTHPDFRHKETGEALWLGTTTPPWATSKLPPVHTKKAT